MSTFADAKPIETPLAPEVAASLRAGELVRLTGVLLTARDAAHQRLVAAIDAGRPLPLLRIPAGLGIGPGNPGAPVAASQD